MGRNRLRLFVFALACCIIAPAFSASAWWGGLWINGNDTGGIIPWSPENQLVAMDAAAGHCARFRKFAHITSIHPWYGDYIAFACTFDPPVTVRSRAVVLRSKG
jgi:hypothetical protein